MLPFIIFAIDQTENSDIKDKAEKIIKSSDNRFIDINTFKFWNIKGDIKTMEKKK